MMPINDALFLMAEAREKPMHVGGLQLFRMPEGAGPGTLGELYRTALEQGDVHPKLSRRPVHLAGVGPWTWEKDPRLDLAYHVRHSALPYPGRIRELLALVSRLHGTLLDRNRPLWEAHLIEGLADGQFALYTKIHHALVDGVSAMRLLENALSPDPDLLDMPPPWATPAGWHDRRRRTAVVEDASSAGPGGLMGLAGQAVGSARGLVEGVVGGARTVVGVYAAALRSLVKGFQDEAQALPYKAPRSMLNVPITGARRFAAQSFEVSRINEVRRATGATLNDVVMAMCAGALRRYLLDHGALPDEPLVAMVPVSLHAAEDDTGNAVGIVLCNLGTNVEDPAERLALVRRSMQEGKLRLEGLDATGIMMLSALSFAPLALGPLFRFEAFRRPPFNVVISNVPGPRNTLYWRGMELLGSYPASILTDGQAMNITVNTYAGSLEVGILGDRLAVPSMQRMLDHLEESLLELEKLG